ncbi:MAG TPA: hypothetical protein VK508_01275 [Cyclobacteriaceae bacterium]|nr:hypothetical protein [Cyclobacteriaceae bacterium]
METFESFEEVLYQVNGQSFDEIALRLFHFQAKHNPVYSEYIRHLGVVPHSVKSPDNIPFLPVSLFRTHEVKTGKWPSQVVFTSSGTTETISSRHAIHNLRFYLDNAARSFSFFYGDPGNYAILALLPSYVERGGSSLIAMIEDFIIRSKTIEAGFYHNKPGDFLEALENLSKKKGKKVIVWGVTYALLDLADERELDLSNCIVMETGGMKGRRKEITRAELHEYLGRRLHSERIHSEYGMTELMSQAYSEGNGVFRCPPWMRVTLRDPEDPRDVAAARQRGGINIIDLANIRSCAFIETQDLGRTGQNGNFEVLGRMDNSDIRGCNLLVE